MNSVLLSLLYYSHIACNILNSINTFLNIHLLLGGKKVINCHLVYVHIVRNVIMKTTKAQFLYHFLLCKKYFVVENVLTFYVCAI